MNAVEIINLTKYYGNQKGIENLSLTVKEGEMFGFVGKNGAGKSTTIRTLLNFLYPSSGKASIFGYDIETQTKEIKKITSYLPSEVSYYENMTVAQLFSYTLGFLEEKDKERVTKLSAFFELDLKRNISDLSLGNRKKVSVIQCLLKKPKLLILDEPTSGLDPLMQKKFFEVLKEEKARGCTIFLSSHNLSEIEKYCDRVAIIKDGSIVDVVERNHFRSEDKFRVKYTLKDGSEKTYVYDGDLNKLTLSLSKLDLVSLEVGPASIEEEFIKYYKEGDSVENN